MSGSRTRLRRFRSILATLIPLLAVLVAGLVLAAPANAADSDIRINEVSSNPNDFVELINTGLAPIDINGWRFADIDHASVPIVSTSTVIQPGGRFSFDPNALVGGFGLGATDAANVFNAGGTAIDSYSWTSHRIPSYGRCPEGTGPMVVQTAVTPGAANTCSGPSPSAIKINEVSSNPNDFVELINTGTAAIDLLGWTFADSDHSPIAIVGASTLIAPGGYYTFDPNTLPGGFGLDSADAATIRSGTTLVDTYSWTTHRIPSYGRCPNGSGDFVANTAITQNAANACPVVIPSVVINEVESNGDTVGDWVELKNTGTTPVNISGWNVRDNDPTHAFEVVPASTTLQPGGYYSIYTEFTPAPGFGLGTADSANLYLPDGTTLVDSYSWTAHAATTYGRCPDGTGSFVTTTTPTRNGANACSAIRINEIGPNGGPGGHDYVEFKNISSSVAGMNGWKLQDVASNTTWPIPNISWAGGNYALIDQTAFGFDMSANDTLRLLDSNNAVVEQYSWNSMPTNSWGRCKDGVGDFAANTAQTPGHTNACPGIATSPWPGGQTVTTADNTDTFVQDLSGLVFDPSNPDVLWGAQNKKGTLFKLVRDASNNWVPAAGWPRDPKFLGGTGSPDTEGITIGPDGFVYLTSERDNDNSGVSKNTILRFDPNSPAGPTISPTTEWDLNSFLPTVGANLGLEGVTFVPDSFLVGGGFKDQSTGQAYDPDHYPLHGSGLYFVAVEANGSLVGFALDSDGTPHKVATVASGLAQLADVDWDPELRQLRAVADDTWDGETVLLGLDGTGSFVPTAAYDRPAGMPNLNNEGLAIAPQSRCVAGKKEVLWSDDGDTDGHSIRRGTINCTPPAAQTVTFTTDAPTDARIGQTYLPAATGGGSGNPVVITVDPASSSVCSIALGVVSLNGTGTCTLNADQDAAQGFLAGHAQQSFSVSKADQTITFAQPGDAVFGSSDVPLTASASSGLDVALTSETPAVCTVVAGAAHPVTAGTCTVTATQGGNDVYNAAAPVSRSLTVAKATQTITFTQPGDTVFGGADVPLSATSDAGLPVTLTSLTTSVCTIVNGKAHPVGAGTCTIRATQDGDDNHAAATPVTRSLAVAKAAITMTTRATSGLLSLLTFRVTYTTTVVSAVTGQPVAGVPVTTKVNNGAASTGCTATTSASGVASCVSGPVNIQLGLPGISYTATAAATANHLGGTATGLIPLL